MSRPARSSSGGGTGRCHHARPPRPRLVPAALAVLSLAACSDGGDGGGGPATLEEIIPRVATQAGAVASKVCTGLPAAGAGPTLEIGAPAAVLPGGSGIYLLSGSSTFDSVIVAVAGTDCYWLLTTAPGAEQTVLITVGQGAPASFDLLIGAAAAGVVGPRVSVPVALTAVGTGKVQVSVTWDAESDVDLHLQLPTGTEIYYGNDLDSATGAVLDLDSNAACSIDHVKNENITFTKDPPRGTYTVLLDYYDECSVAQTKYVVTVTVAGSATTFAGTFTGLGDGGGQGDGRFVTSFTY